MNAIQEAQAVLADAEKRIRDLISDQLGVQRYMEVAELAALADGLTKLARSAPSNRAATEAGLARPIVGGSANRFSAPENNPRKRSIRDKRDYPRFERANDKLVKIGWSKKAREQYEHRAPRPAVLAFAEHVGATTAKGRPFVIDELLPVHDAAGEELPSYQVYLALAWLRQAGVIEKKGRDGYVRVVDPLDGSVFDMMWDQIPERS